MTHDASFCHCVDGKVDLFIEEERLSRKKHDHMPVKAVMEYCEHEGVGLTGLEYEDYRLGDTAELFSIILKKKNQGTYDLYSDHHNLHALCGFYNSGFEEADVVIVDGMGNYIDEDHQECATRLHLSYPANIALLEKQKAGRYDSSRLQNRTIHQPYPMGIGMAYSSISSYLGFGSLGSGKTMGLAPYGKEDDNIKPFILENNLVNSKLFYRSHDGCVFIPYDYLPEVWDYREWNDDVQKIANLAYRLQKDFEKWMINFILKCDHKNIVLTGGCALNCVANYEYLKHLPKDVNLYIEPVSSDAGTSIGLAKYLYHSKS